MIERKLTTQIIKMAKKMPSIALTGPRQSGKTTLLQEAFPKYDYVNLEHPGVRELAINDPDEFLSRYTKGVILDEVQRAPQLFSYIQVQIDKKKKAGQYILSGSQNFSLLENISQSLAGRVTLYNLLPFSYEELNDAEINISSADQYIFKGSYPGVYHKRIKPVDFYPSYISTYIERDVRQLLNIQNLSQFSTFLKLLAGRNAQLVNLSEIGSVLGIDHKTVRKWISILEASFIVYLLQPYHKNFDKRLVKTPKIYFYDTGLVCHLLGIDNEKQIASHWAKGALFENMVINELIKSRLNAGVNPDFYFWKENSGPEVDLLIQEKGKLKAVEIKSSKTFNSSLLSGLVKVSSFAKIPSKDCYLIYSGEEEMKTKNGHLLNWKNITEI